jgi:Tat protein translocase TatB subunit
MMPGIGFAEMVLLVVVALVVIGPKDLPLMMRKFGRFTGKMRALAFEFKQGIDELGRQARDPPGAAGTPLPSAPRSASESRHPDLRHRRPNPDDATRR